MVQKAMQSNIAAGKDEVSDAGTDSDTEQNVAQDGAQAHSSRAEKAQIELVYSPGAEQQLVAQASHCHVL